LIVLAAPAGAADAIDIRTWKLDESGRAGWSVKKLIGPKLLALIARKSATSQILSFGPDGKVRKLIVTTRGFLGHR